MSKRDEVLRVLLDHQGEWVPGEAFLDGRHGVRLTSYSQRVGALIRAGHPIDRDRNGGGIARYRYRVPEQMALL